MSSAPLTDASQRLIHSVRITAKAINQITVTSMADSTKVGRMVIQSVQRVSLSGIPRNRMANK
ncbi:hypothetical protein HHA01_07000 [Halomonas halmophila]|uniref:Uncharacterized protein n=1 Tax=Halomonas halmophila TaxID=252 RepID=A0A4Y4EX99_9GAMM|nr:hypothetical protein HHA01_07000 [Halomonas halmophila]